MIIRRELTAEHELVKWFLIFALASSLVLIYVAKSASDDTSKSSRSLPKELQRWAIPNDLNQGLLTFEYNETADSGDAADRYALTVKLQQIVNDHRAGNHEQAMLDWQELRLPLEAEVWRSVAMAACYMKTGDDWAAKPYLKDADAVANDNAVLSFLKAELIWHEIQKQGENDRMLASYTSSGSGSGCSPEVLNLAIDVYKKVLAQAPQVDTLATLVPKHWGVPDNGLVEIPVNPPTVGELLQALRLSDYVAVSHSRLGVLYERTGDLESAESQLDEAAELGMDVSSEYLSLARKLKLTGQNAAAHRVFKKALEVQKGGTIYTTPRWEIDEKVDLRV